MSNNGKRNMDANDKRLSYTSASGVFPLKLVVNRELVESILKDKRITPIHVQLYPTNRCNLNCDWCSCSEVDRKVEMAYDVIIDVMTRYKNLGCQAVTISGGGEPFLHERINDIIKTLYDMGIVVGVVTNGWNLSRLEKENANKLTWVRISLGDGRKPELNTPEYWQKIKDVIKYGDSVSWSFSYVLTEAPNFELIEKMIDFANTNHFTHIRMANDIFVADELYGVMSQVRMWAKKRKIDDHLVIYQDRAIWNSGEKRCLISLLKPVVTPGGEIYPCCGIQYALDPPTKNYADVMKIGTIDDIEKITIEQKAFDGTICVKCYYKHYNDLLSFLLSDVEHKRFV